MEKAPGVDPRPGRVPEQELLTPETRSRDGDGTAEVFLEYQKYIQGFHVGVTKQAKGQRRWRPEWAKPPARAAPLLAAPRGGLEAVGLPLACPSGSVCPAEKQEVWLLFRRIPRIFLDQLFWNTKTAENRNWHCGILLIGQSQKMYKSDIRQMQNMQQLV